MKKLILSIVILLLISIHSSGQTTGNTTNKDTTKAKVELPLPAGQAVVKDLIRKDSCEKELEVTKINLQIANNTSEQKDKIISNKDQEIGAYKQKEINYISIISNKDLALVTEKRVSDQLAKDLKQTKRKKTRNEILGGVIIGLLTYAFITK
jgi:hypothetical protein